MPWRTIGFEGIVGIEVVWLKRCMRVSPMHVARIREYEDARMVEAEDTHENVVYRRLSSKFCVGAKVSSSVSWRS